jgi:putative endonuclease
MSRVSDKPYFLYLLWSSTARRFYIGISEHPEKRVIQHNAGESKWTSRAKDWKLVHLESFTNYADARRRELFLKKQKGGHGFFQSTGLDPSQFRSRQPPSGSNPAAAGSSVQICPRNHS